MLQHNSNIAKILSNVILFNLLHWDVYHYKDPFYLSRFGSDSNQCGHLAVGLIRNKAFDGEIYHRTSHHHDNPFMPDSHKIFQ